MARAGRGGRAPPALTGPRHREARGRSQRGAGRALGGTGPRRLPSVRARARAGRHRRLLPPATPFLVGGVRVGEASEGGDQTVGAPTPAGPPARARLQAGSSDLGAGGRRRGAPPPASHGRVSAEEGRGRGGGGRGGGGRWRRRRRRGRRGAAGATSRFPSFYRPTVSMHLLDYTLPTTVLRR